MSLQKSNCDTRSSKSINLKEGRKVPVSGDSGCIDLNKSIDADESKVYKSSIVYCCLAGNVTLLLSSGLVKRSFKFNVYVCVCDFVAPIRIDINTMWFVNCEAS